MSKAPLYGNTNKPKKVKAAGATKMAVKPSIKPPKPTFGKTKPRKQKGY